MQNLSWQEEALCAKDDPNILKVFYYDPEEDDVDYTSEAKQICAQCPVRRQCLQYALDNEERFGVWGGSDETSRRWALSIDQYGKPIQRIRGMKCPYCSGTNLKTISKERTKTHIQCGTCQLAWWSRKLGTLHPVDADMEDESDNNLDTDF